MLHTLALRADRQSALMSEVKNGRFGLYGKMQQLEKMGFKWLNIKKK